MQIVLLSLVELFGQTIVESNLSKDSTAYDFLTFLEYQPIFVTTYCNSRVVMTRAFKTV